MVNLKCNKSKVANTISLAIMWSRHLNNLHISLGVTLAYGFYAFACSLQAWLACKGRPPWKHNVTAKLLETQDLMILNLPVGELLGSCSRDRHWCFCIVPAKLVGSLANVALSIVVRLLHIMLCTSYLSALHVSHCIHSSYAIEWPLGGSQLYTARNRALCLVLEPWYACSIISTVPQALSYWTSSYVCN